MAAPNSNLTVLAQSGFNAADLAERGGHLDLAQTLRSQIGSLLLLAGFDLLLIGPVTTRGVPIAQT